MISDRDVNVIKSISPKATTKKELKMLPLNIGLYMPFVIVIITVTAYFSLLIKLKPSKDTKLLAYLSQTKRKLRKKKKPPKDLSVLPSPEPDFEEKPSSSPSEQKECPHYVGYLTSLPKGSPFPEECFGCRNVIKCLRVEPTKVIESFYMGSSAER